MKSPLSLLGSSSTKANIIELLSEEWPLTAKKVYNQLTKKYSLSITYQATHKALKELNQNNILDRKKEGYLLNKEWVGSLGQLSERITKELNQSGEKREVKTCHKLVFKNHSDFIKWSVDLTEEIIKKEGKLDQVFLFRHVPYPHSISREDIVRLMPLMPKIKWKIYSRESTILDKWFAKFWRKMGVEVKLGQDVSTNSILILMNDYIITLHFSKKAREEWDKIFSVKKIRDSDMDEMTETLLNTNQKAVLTVFRDKEIANLLRNGF